MGANDKADSDPAAIAGRVQGVADENARTANRDMPGGRAGMPPGSLRPLPPDPQSDENRDQGPPTPPPA
jgi:hypothetical protein